MEGGFVLEEKKRSFGNENATWSSFFILISVVIFSFLLDRL